MNFIFNLKAQSAAGLMMSSAKPNGCEVLPGVTLHKDENGAKYWFTLSEQVPPKFKKKVSWGHSPKLLGVVKTQVLLTWYICYAGYQVEKSATYAVKAQ